MKRFPLGFKSISPTSVYRVTLEETSAVRVTSIPDSVKGFPVFSAGLVPVAPGKMLCPLFSPFFQSYTIQFLLLARSTVWVLQRFFSSELRVFTATRNPPSLIEERLQSAVVSCLVSLEESRLL